MRAITGEPVVYVATSGETLIRDLPLLTSASTIVAIIAFKTIAYAVSLGAGFRGGPFGPAWFIGASWGLLASLMLPTGPSAQAAIVVGVVAGTIATQRMRWSIAIILGIVIGFLMGTWTLVPAAVVGAVVARAIPRVADRLEPATP
jgi:H+/Cl- antiporter ClcA